LLLLLNATTTLHIHIHKPRYMSDTHIKIVKSR
jgi:hypothetical protein